MWKNIILKFDREVVDGRTSILLEHKKENIYVLKVKNTIKPVYRKIKKFFIEKQIGMLIIENENKYRVIQLMNIYHEKDFICYEVRIYEE